jgi:hypothetical protein
MTIPKDKEPAYLAGVHALLTNSLLPAFDERVIAGDKDVPITFTDADNAVLLHYHLSLRGEKTREELVDAVWDSWHALYERDGVSASVVLSDDFDHSLGEEV